MASWNSLRLAAHRSLHSISARRITTLFLLIFGIWTSLALLFALQFHVRLYPNSLPYFFDNWTMAALTPLVIYVAERANFPSGRRMHDTCVHLAWGCVLCIAKAALRVWVLPDISPLTLREFPRTLTLFREVLTHDSYSFLLWVYVPVACIFYTVHSHFREQQRSVREAHLDSQLAQARLRLLQAQLRPHFLFNTLHAISALISTDPSEARRTLVRLGELLRTATDSVHTDESTLREELAFTQGYLEIEQTRFGERLRVEFDIEESALDASVPNLLLQPLVENAVKHGIEPCAQPGKITVSARRLDDELRIRVWNTCPASGRRDWSHGVGLANICHRLQQLYRERQYFKAVRNGREFEVQAWIPWKVIAENKSQGLPKQLSAVSTPYENSYAHR